MDKIELTQEQKDCVEYPLQEQILIIDADPGTGKTEILRHRVKFIHQQNKKQRKFILVLAVGKNISRSIKNKLKEEGLKKIHHSLRTIIPEFSHQVLPCEEIDCPKCQETQELLAENELSFYSELATICQENQTKNDLKRNLLTLIIEIFGHPQTNFTFVGDPKQNIMAFAGATDNIFQLLKEKFPNCAQKEISISFRVPQEVATMANDFTGKFMPYKPKLTTNQTNGGKKPVIFLADSEKSYQLTGEEENKIAEKLTGVSSEENTTKKNQKIKNLKNKLIKEEIRAKKLRKQVEFILSIINRLDKNSSRVILHRKNEIDEERAEAGLSEKEVKEFIRQIDKQLMERDIENAGKTRLSSIHKAKGLEFDYVFLISVDEEILPSKNLLA
ncbi:1801_t:CDS:2 [Gigaspora margarita]|uniref:1801_t:CDS:1 n=1 Tax=Gigaspora margarita TaxID=4874 RepID=A0ABM8W1P6_GIGMA|nr:1801_t:CDS:2 [Gigaspora margarita]